MTPYTFSWDFISATSLKVPTPNKTVWFEFSTPNQIFGNGSETITVTFTDMTRLQNYAYGFGMINSTVSFNSLVPQESSES